MLKRIAVLILCVSALASFAQPMQPARHELEKSAGEQQCPFELLEKQGVLYAYQTDQASEEDNVFWSFVRLDTNLLEVRSDLIPLPVRYAFCASQSNPEMAVFLFTDGRAKKSDSIGMQSVLFHRATNTFTTFQDKLPPGSAVLGMALIDEAVFVPVNYKSGGGSVLYYDSKSGMRRVLQPRIDSDYAFFQAEANEAAHTVVVAAKEFEGKRNVATTFLQYGADGGLLASNRYQHEGDVTLGRLCFDFDMERNLSVYATVERQETKKVDLKELADDFDKVAVGVACIRFSDGQPQTHSYLFKDMPDIERALTASDRVRVREDRLKQKRNKQKESKEIGFQFLAPHLTKIDGMYVFSAEAFVPEYHTEARMDYGFYGMFPYSYTVFDGYDFISTVLWAFDATGALKWQSSVKFDNALSYDLWPHSDVTNCLGELLVVSARDNRLRYEVLDGLGQILLEHQHQPLDLLYEVDFLTREGHASMSHWYDNRFIVSGEQIIQNGVRSKPRRMVFFWQKVQFE